MEKRTKYSVTLPDGSKATRSSANPYTHVLVGREDFTRTRDRIGASPAC